MNYRLVFLTFLLGSLFSGCVRLPDDSVDNPENNPWKLIDFNIERKILNSFATPESIFFLTENEFIKLDAEQNLLEKRLIPSNELALGQPAISYNTFVRLTENTIGEHNLHFSLTKTPNEIIKVASADLTNDPDETIKIEHTGRHIATYNTDGSQILIPALSYKGNFHYVFFIMDVKLDPTTLHLNAVEVSKRIDITEMTNTNALSSMRYIDGNYYVASKNGGYRISEDGAYIKVRDEWLRDIFKSNSLFFATGANDDDFFISTDNGMTWSRESSPSALKLVAIEGDYIFSQSFAGYSYHIPTPQLGFQSITPVLMNEDFPEDNNSYFSIEYLKDNYYLTVQNKIYYSDVIKLDN